MLNSSSTRERTRIEPMTYVANEATLILLNHLRLLEHATSGLCPVRLHPYGRLLADVFQTFKLPT